MREMKAKLELQHKRVRIALEEVYIAAEKFKAMPHHDDFRNLMRKSVEDGISAAELAVKRYNELKKEQQQ